MHSMGFTKAGSNTDTSLKMHILNFYKPLGINHKNTRIKLCSCSSTINNSSMPWEYFFSGEQRFEKRDKELLNTILASRKIVL